MLLENAHVYGEMFVVYTCPVFVAYVGDRHGAVRGRRPRRPTPRAHPHDGHPLRAQDQLRRRPHALYQDVGRGRSNEVSGSCSPPSVDHEI